MTLRIELYEHNKATCRDISIIRNKGSVIDAVARELLKQGADEDELVEVYRDGTLCFKPISLKRWAVNTVRDHDVTGLRVVKFEPFSERK